MDKRSGWSFEEDPMEEMEDLAEASIENLAQHFFDSYERENAAFRRSSGLKVTVIREELGDCCSWCADLAGVYEYGSEPKDVWARHAHCRCMVVTKTERGTYQDAWSRKEYQSQREARIAREEEIEAELKKDNLRSELWDNVTTQFLEMSTPGKGDFIKEIGFKEQNNEATIAKWLHDSFGGDIILRADNEKEGVMNPDYLWRGRLWDLKSPVSAKKSTIEGRIRHGVEQIAEKPGGVIVDLSKSPLEWDEIFDAMRRIVGAHNFQGIDLIIKKNERFAIIRPK